MAGPSPGEVPREDGLNRDLAGKTPQMMTTFAEVRKGWGAIHKAGIRLLASDGSEKNSEIADTMIEPNADKFNLLMRQLGCDDLVMTRLIADAAKVAKPSDSNRYSERLLYLGGLFDGARRIAVKIGNDPYTGLPEPQRLKIAGHLFRPPEERTLTWNERVGIMYPKMALDVLDGTCNPEEIYEVSGRGLGRIVRTVIEAGPLNPSPKGFAVDEAWKAKGWGDFVDMMPIPEDLEDIRKTQKEKRQYKPLEKHEESFKGYLPHYNCPEAIEYIIRDVVNYMSTGLPQEKEERNLDKIVGEALKVMPHRKRLEELDYFHEKKTEGERHNMLQNIFEGRALF
ncbi:MAG: hypothetical protein V1875_03440 [Candidatus Altiarchaeota archaeon]